MEDRGTGATTNQMVTAPKNSVYVWCNGELSYPKSLAERWGRKDLEIVSPSWLTRLGYLGRSESLSAIVIDHATRLDGNQQEHLFRAARRLKKASA